MFFVLKLNLSKEQSCFCVARLDPELVPCMLGSYLFDVVGSSFNEQPQSYDFFGQENYVHTSIQPTILSTSYLLNIVQ